MQHTVPGIEKTEDTKAAYKHTFLLFHFFINVLCMWLYRSDYVVGLCVYCTPVAAKNQVDHLDDSAYSLHLYRIW